MVVGNVKGLLKAHVPTKSKLSIFRGPTPVLRTRKMPVERDQL